MVAFTFIKSGGDMSQITTTHGQLMDGVYRYQRHFYDATRKYYLLGRDRLIENLRPPKNGTVLEIGCGTGRNLIAVGKSYPDAKLYGFDISSEMLSSARRSIKSALKNRQVSLVLGDATNFDPNELFGIVSFDRIFISYSISMIPDSEKALAMAFDALSPHGELHIVDFGDQAEMPSLFRVILRRWLALFHVTPRDNLDVMLSALAARKNAKLAFRSLLRGYSQIAIVTRVI
jgi:S-adenosylmethionine-diacylgycerolhomoserine-N-methlytransferase